LLAGAPATAAEAGLDALGTPNGAFIDRDWGRLAIRFFIKFKFSFLGPGVKWNEIEMSIHREKFPHACKARVNCQSGQRLKSPHLLTRPRNYKIINKNQTTHNWECLALCIIWKFVWERNKG
jgi:hypothetical protein